MNTKLSNREKEILSIITTYISQHQYPPSIREICELANLSSTSTVAAHLNKLALKGYIESDAQTAGTPRAIRVVGYKFVKENAI